MDPGILIALIAGAVALASGYFTYRASSQTNHISATKVDAEAYDRARHIYEGGLAESERQVEMLRKQVERLEQQVEHEREVSTTLQRQVHDLRRTVAAMERHIALMRTHMLAAGVSPPEGLAG